MSGRLITVVGAMGSGKTKRLINTFKEIENSGKAVIVYKPIKDTRGKDMVVRARNGATAPAIPVADIDEVYEYVSETRHTVLIDEVQFFTDVFDIETLISITMLGVDVYCFGLDLTSEGDVFGQMGLLMAHSDEVIKLEGVCAGCGEKSRMTSYNGSDKDTVIKVGDLDEYEPLCRDCYFKSNELDALESIEDPYHLVTVGGKELGFTMELAVAQSSLDKAGYSLEDVKDICTLEGANNLIEDLGLLEGGD